MKISSESTMTAPALGVTAGDLAKWASSVPADAQVTARTQSADRPGETSITTYTARWTVQK